MPLGLVRFPAWGRHLLFPLPPPRPHWEYWLIADHSCMFLPGELCLDCGSFAWKCLEGFVSSLKPSSDENVVARAQFPYLKVEKGWRAIYAQQLPVGSSWKHPLASSSVLSCFSLELSPKSLCTINHAHSNPSPRLCS